MANPFDEFDAPITQASPSSAANPFDEFDAPTQSTAGNLPVSPQQQTQNANALSSQSTSPLAALTGYGSNISKEVGLSDLGSAIAAEFGAGQGDTAQDRYTNLQGAQSAMQNAGQQLYPDPTKLGQVSGDVVKYAPMVGEAANLASSGIKGAQASIAKGVAATTTDAVAPLDPVDIIRQHAASQAAAKDVNNLIGNNLRTMAGDSVRPAPEARDALQSLRDEITAPDAAPIKNRGQTVKAIDHALSQFDENGNMPVSSALDLKTLANQNFKDTQNMYTGSWGNVRSAADSVLSAHALENPEFGDMLNLQRVHNANDVGEAYTNNSKLQSMFDKSDMRNVSDADKGILRNVGTDTQNAADALVGKVQTPADYRAVSRGISDPQVQAQFNQAVLDNNPEPSLMGRVGSGVKAIFHAKTGNVTSAAGHAAEAVNPEEQAQALRDAVKANQTVPTKYQVEQTADKANDIMNQWKARKTLGPRPNMRLAPPATQVPPGGFTPNYEGVGPDINYNAGQKALPAPKEMSYEDQVRAGRILPPPGAASIEAPPGGFRTTYNPNDLNAGDEVGFQGGTKPINVRPNYPAGPRVQRWVDNPATDAFSGLQDTSNIDPGPSSAPTGQFGIDRMYRAQGGRIRSHSGPVFAKPRSYPALKGKK